MPASTEITIGFCPGGSLGNYRIMTKTICVVILFLGIYVAQETRPRKPHIVMVISDDHGYYDVGFTGSLIKTPVLDSLAREGVRLESYYVQPICTPSRSQLLSGRYQIHTGLQHLIIFPLQPSALPLTVPGSPTNEPLRTLPELLKELGYATHGTGKWHLGHFQRKYTAIKRGFDSFLGIHPGRADHFDYTLTRDCDGTMESGECLTFNNEIIHRNEYSTWLYNNRSTDVILGHDPSEGPLFLYVAHQTVHNPLQVPEFYEKEYENVYNDTNEPFRRTKAAMVTSLDKGIGAIVRALKAKDMWKDTVFIFMSDNGAMNHEGGKNYPYRGWKNSHFEGAIRSPGIVVSPGLLGDRAGTTTPKGELIHISDWYPTLVNLVGGSVGSRTLDGIDVWDVISGQSSVSPRKEILYNIDPMQAKQGTPYPNVSFDTTVHAAIRVGKWKLITGWPGIDGQPTPDTEEEEVHEIHVTEPLWDNILLFDIERDPFETTDIAKDNEDVVLRLLNRLAEYNRTAVSVWFPDLDPKACPSLHNGTYVPWLDE